MVFTIVAYFPLKKKQKQTVLKKQVILIAFTREKVAYRIYGVSKVYFIIF